MRFISKYAGHSVKVRTQRNMELADGRTQVLDERIIADFEQGDVNEWEVEVALKALGPFKGLPTYQDGVTSVGPRYRLAGFDTEQWLRSNAYRGFTEEDKKLVEDHLLAHPMLGIDFIRVERPKTPAPWPAYDKLTSQGRRTIEMIAEKIVAKVMEDEYDPEQVVAYERENLNREAVITALQAIGEPSEEETLVEA